jgi:hypothetical protein
MNIGELRPIDGRLFDFGNFKCGTKSFDLFEYYIIKYYIIK